MKKITFCLFYLLSVFSFAQTENTEFERMVESEMKSASNLQTMAVNPNTQNYNVTYHELRFTVDPANYFISGVVTTTFTALSNMTTVTFDLTNELTVSAVTLAGSPLGFTQNANEELVITLPSVLNTGSNATVVISYSGAPASGEAAFTATTHSGTPVIYTLSEPFGARDWWPCKQDLNDKVESIDVYITAPSTYTSLAKTLTIMNLYENLFEAYPFHQEKYGHEQFGWGGGMEHTTVSFMGSWGRNLIAHELAHQWFGDKITCGSWKDIWLNEGFAEYLSGLVVENLDGAASFVSWKNSKISNITSVSNGAVFLTDTEAENVNRIFSSRLTYNKGSMVVHMLRWKMGDAAFFQAVKNYLADTNLAYGYALTNNLKSHLEAVYGSSLTEFFNDWLYMQGYPTYTVTAQNWGPGQAKITVSQTQSDPSVSYFEMPLEIRLTSAGGANHDVVVNHITNGQEFVVAVPFVVAGVTFDPNKHIISKNNVVTLGNETFQLDETISIYPNPTNDKLHIMMPTNVQLEKVEIYNTLGQLVALQSTVDFSVNNLSSGLHLIKITTSEGIIHKNFIKK